MSSRTALWAMLAAALVVRVAYVVIQDRLRLLEVNFIAGDTALYLEIAHSIADGQGMRYQGHPTAYVTPGYPLFLAAVLRLGLDTLAIGLVQAALGAATVGIVGALAGELARRAGLARHDLAAILAAAIAALYPHLILWTGYVLTETFFVFLALAALYVTLRAIPDRPLWAFLGGLLTAAATLTRPAELAVGALIVAWWILARGRPRQRAVAIAVFLFGLGIPLAMWTARNAAELGAPIITSTGSGLVFYAANSRTSTGGTRGYLDGHDYTLPTLDPTLDEVEVDSTLRSLALQEVADDPGAFVAKLPAKLWNMWRPTYEGASLRNGVVTLLSYVPLLVCGTLGALTLARRDARGPGILPLLFLVSWLIAHLIAAGLIRYRLPAEAALSVTSAIWIATLVSARRPAPRPISA